MSIANETFTYSHEASMSTTNGLLHLPTKHKCLLLMELLHLPTKVSMHVTTTQPTSYNLLVKVLLHLRCEDECMLHEEFLEMLFWCTIVCNPLKWGLLRLSEVCDMRGWHWWKGYLSMIGNVWKAHQPPRVPTKCLVCPRHGFNYFVLWHQPPWVPTKCKKQF